MNKHIMRLMLLCLIMVALVHCNPKPAADTSADADADSAVVSDAGSDQIVPPEQGGPGFEKIAADLGYVTYEIKPEDLKYFGDPRAVKGGALTSFVGRFPATMRTEGQNSNYLENSTFGNMIYEGMVTTHPINLEFMPVLATHWKISDDKMQFWFRLNPDARYSDGHDVIAEDVVATWDLHMDETILSPSDQLVYGKYERPVAESKYIVSVKCKELNWRNFLYFGGMSVLPSYILNNLDGTEYLKEYQFKMLPGTGSYIIYPEDVVSQESYTLTRRTDYWAKDDPTNRYSGNFDKIKFVVVKENISLMFEKFKKKEADFFVVAQARRWTEECDFDSVKKGWIKKRKIYSERPAGTSGYAFNLRKWPFDDRRIRYAFSYLYNREKMNEEMYYSEYEMMNSLYHGSVYENPGNEKVIYNPEKAVEFLKEAGYNERNEDGWLVHDETAKILRFEIGIPKTSAYMVTPVQQMLKDYGVDMQINFVDGNTMWKNLMERNFTIYAQNWGGLVFPNPETSLNSALADSKYNNNISGFQNARVDELCAEYDREFDQKRRVEIIREIDGIYSDIHPAAWGIARMFCRLMYWDKFGHPEHMVGRYTGDERSIYGSWWLDPEKEARLNAAKENDENLEQGEVMVKYWPKLLEQMRLEEAQKAEQETEDQEEEKQEPSES